MKSLKEALVHKHIDNNFLNNFRSLKYGDIIKFEQYLDYYGALRGPYQHIGLYVPNKVLKKLWRTIPVPEDDLGAIIYIHHEVGPHIWGPREFLWKIEAGVFKDNFPLEVDDDGNTRHKIIDKLSHTDKYQNIKSQKEAKEILEEYAQIYG